EDGIRDFHVTGVQTCALPILYGILPVGPQSWRWIRLGAYCCLNRCLSMEGLKLKLCFPVSLIKLRCGLRMPIISCGKMKRMTIRSEERRVGKEGRYGG